jgi:hypothetical protein
MDFKKLYQNAKIKAAIFMENGQITNYVKALKEMNQYKKMMTIVASN